MELWCLLLQAAVIISGAQSAFAQEHLFNLTISDLPRFAIECLAVTLPFSGCSVLDEDCQCESNDLTIQTAFCILENCTMDDSLQTSKVQASLCNLENPSQSASFIVAISILIGVSTVLLVVRMVSKTPHFIQAFGFDDACITLALFMAIIPVACLRYPKYSVARLGFGKHIWGLQPGRLVRILFLFWVAENTYVIVHSLIKLSILLFYLRIFSARYFRIAVWITFGFVTTSSLIHLCLTIFACKPISFFWNRDFHPHGTCLDINALAYAKSGMAVFEDLVIIILPLTQLRKLDMTRRKKLAVGFMFVVGSFGCITSMVRLRSLLVFGNSVDPTWDYVPVVRWTAAELATGFICACLPSIRVIIRKCLRRRDSRKQGGRRWWMLTSEGRKSPFLDRGSPDISLKDTVIPMTSKVKEPRKKPEKDERNTKYHLETRNREPLTALPTIQTRRPVFSGHTRQVDISGPASHNPRAQKYWEKQSVQKKQQRESELRRGPSNKSKAPRLLAVPLSPFDTESIPPTPPPKDSPRPWDYEIRLERPVPARHSYYGNKHEYFLIYYGIQCQDGYELRHGVGCSELRGWSDQNGLRFNTQ